MLDWGQSTYWRWRRESKLLVLPLVRLADLKVVKIFVGITSGQRAPNSPMPARPERLGRAMIAANAAE
jgi:hypothetical protein